MTIQDEYIDGEATPGDPADYERRHDLALYYYSNGQLWRAQWSTFALAEGLVAEDSHRVVATREFRYDDPRARYVTADYAFQESDIPPDANNPLDLQYPLALTDYLGTSPTGDAELSRTGAEDDYSFPVDVYTNYFLGLYGQQDAGSGEPTYYHGDMIGSTLATSDDAQELVQVVAYTAFGEHVELTGTPDPNDANVTIWSAAIGRELPEGFPRYAYAGQHGYESGLLSRTGANPNLPPITLQHLGWRWYDPAIGRFVQRDPIGIAGGMNVYAYTGGAPLSQIDPEGLRRVVRTGQVEWRKVGSVWKRNSNGELVQYFIYEKFVQYAVLEVPTFLGKAGLAVGAAGTAIAWAPHPAAKVAGWLCVGIGTAITWMGFDAEEEVTDTYWEGTGEVMELIDSDTIPASPAWRRSP